MSRKVFISFLGATNYIPVKYYSEGQLIQNLPSLRFVQEATISKFCQNFTSEDRICILTTKIALKNWNDGYHYNRQLEEEEWHEGLGNRIAHLNLSCQVENTMVSNGQSKEETWEIFSTIFSLFEEKDQVYFDITHGFRTLPMLNLVLINYAKLLKNISVKGIYYGAYEAKKVLKGVEVAPIWDLTDFAKLQDWTINASIFLNTGNAEALAKQIESPAYQNLKKNLKSFSEYTLVNRGLDLYNGQTMIDLKAELQTEITPKDPAFTALNPILKKIEKEFDGYHKNSSINGFLAARWCINNGLIQQAFTLLEEFVTSFVMEELDLVEDLSHKEKRGTITAALSIRNLEDFRHDNDPGLKNWQENVIRKMQAYEYRKALHKLAVKIKNSARNDISHAGFREKPRTFIEFKKSAVKRYKELTKILETIRKVELPAID